MTAQSKTAARFALIEHTAAPGVLVAPPHTHRREDEYSFVLEGAIVAQVGEAITRVPAGSLLFKPRGVPHAFWADGNRPARVLEVISPAGFERFFEEFTERAAALQPADEEAMIALLLELGERYAVEFHLDAIPPLLERYGLRL